MMMWYKLCKWGVVAILSWLRPWQATMEEAPQWRAALGGSATSSLSESHSAYEIFKWEQHCLSMNGRHCLPSGKSCNTRTPVLALRHQGTEWTRIYSREISRHGWYGNSKLHRTEMHVFMTRENLQQPSPNMVLNMMLPAQRHKSSQMDPINIRRGGKKEDRGAIPEGLVQTALADSHKDPNER